MISTRRMIFSWMSSVFGMGLGFVSSLMCTESLELPIPVTSVDISQLSGELDTFVFCRCITALYRGTPMHLCVCCLLQR